MSNMDEKVCCLKYGLSVSQSLFHQIHGQSYNLIEFYIPSHKIAFNKSNTDYGFKINVFEKDKPRNLITEEVFFPKKFIDDILLIHEYQNKCELYKKNIETSELWNN
jgi:hypothetical protein